MAAKRTDSTFLYRIRKRGLKNLVNGRVDLLF